MQCRLLSCTQRGGGLAAELQFGSAACWMWVVSQLFVRSAVVLPGLVWSKKRRAEAFVCLGQLGPGVLEGRGAALLYARLCPQEQGGR